MRGSTLTKLLSLYRQEARLGQASNLNVGDEPAQIMHIQRVQEDIWSEFDWPFLQVDRDVPVQLNQRYYSLPVDLDIDRIIQVRFRDGSNWYHVTPGINYAEYSTTDSDTGKTSWPVRNWQLHDGEQIEVWPIPNRNASVVPGTSYDGILRFTGIRKLKPLVGPSDVADLDDKMIALYCGAERLAASGSKDAQFKLDKANARYARLRGNATPKRSFNMFSSLQPRGPDFIRRSVTYRAPGT